MDVTQHPTRSRAQLLLWLAFLAGPLIWCAYFSLIYMIAEAACATNKVILDFQLAGMPALSVVVVASTVIASLIMLYFTWQSFQLWKSARRKLKSIEQHSDIVPETRNVMQTAGERSQFMAFAGMLLSLSFLVATLYVGLPALVLRPC